jgi:nucleotide-binding universal stress UspA family protein
MMDYKNILFCTDFSEDAHIAFSHALNLAKKYGARLHILHVPHSPSRYRRDVVDEHVPQYRSHEGEAFYGKDIEEQAEESLREIYVKRLGDFKDYLFAIRCGAPDIEILRYARQNEIDVIVMGALGKSERDRIDHGSTVANVFKYAHCHVVAIRNPAKQFTLPDKMY